MRIAIDARYLNGRGSGIGSYTENLARQLLEVDASLELLLVCHRAPDRQRIDHPRVDEVVFPFDALSPVTRHLLGRFMRGRRFDLFHTPFDIVPAALDRPLVSTLHDINWIINSRFNHNAWWYRKAVGSFYHRHMNHSLREARRVITVSEASRRGIVDYAPWYEEKVKVVHNGFDPTRAEPMNRHRAFSLLTDLFPADTPFVLTIGHGSPHKNHRNAVRGFLRAFARQPEIRMVLVRRIAYRDPVLDRLVSSPEAGGRVLVLPHVSGEVLHALLSAARIFLHPSFFEGFGIPLVEAMAMGVPLATSNVSAMPEVAGDAAVYFSPGNPDSIAQALVRLHRDEDERARVVAAGAKRVKRFTWRRCAEQTLAIYREVLDDPDINRRLHEPS